jgi:hypothetical protein
MGKLDGHMQVAAICEAFGWTYQQYHDQPAHFIELIKGRMRIDAKEQELQSKKSKRG